MLFFIFREFLVGDHPDLAEEYAIIFMILVWIIYCPVAWQMAWLIGRFASGKCSILLMVCFALLIIGGLASIAKRAETMLYTSGNPLEEAGSFLLGLGTLSLPFLWGWASGRKKKIILGNLSTQGLPMSVGIDNIKPKAGV